MQTRITADEIRAAARQLAKSEQGRTALGRLAVLLEGQDFDLDLLNQRAFLAVLGGAWSAQLEVARESVRTALGDDVR